MAVIECVPNVSEGRRTDVIKGLADALEAVPGLRVLDVQSDAAHNRSVFTLAGDAAAMAAGIPTLFEGAVAAIDLRSHKGEHPRLGAVDVVPFIPIEGVTMDDVRPAGEVDRRGCGVAIFVAGLSLRRSVEQSGAEESRRHPPRRVRRPGREDGAAGMGARLWARHTAPRPRAPR